MRMNGAARVLGAAMALAAPPVAIAQVTVVSETAASQADSQRFVLHSERTNREYVVVVTGPRRVAEGANIPAELLAEHQLPEESPVIYALDGGLGVMAPAAYLLGFNFVMQPAYVVSIDYAEEWGPEQWAARSHDLLYEPVNRDGQSFGGGGAQFETFLLEELRPFIESRFPVDAGRAILAGHSLGGLFAATVLVSRPEAFTGYLIASPSISENPAILDKAREAVRRGTRERVFVSVGALEDAFMVRDAERLALVLSDPASGFIVRSQVFEGQEHVPSYLASIPYALPFLLPPSARKNAPVLTVDPGTLRRYVGVYRITGTGQVAITLEDGRLFARLRGQPRVELVALSDREFIARDEALRVTFEVDREGNVTALSLGAARYY